MFWAAVVLLVQLRIEGLILVIGARPFVETAPPDHSLLHRIQHHERNTELARLSTALVDRAVATVLAHRHAFPAYLLKCYYFEIACPDLIERNSSLHIRWEGFAVPCPELPIVSSGVPGGEEYQEYPLLLSNIETLYCVPVFAFCNGAATATSALTFHLRHQLLSLHRSFFLWSSAFTIQSSSDRMVGRFLIAVVRVKPQRSSTVLCSQRFISITKVSVVSALICTFPNFAEDCAVAYERAV